MMRASLVLSLISSLVLAACSTSGTVPPSKHIAQSGALKVHPGLLGEPVPSELQEPVAKPVAEAAAPVEAAPAVALDAQGVPEKRALYFDYRSTEIKADAEPVLKAHAQYLAATPRARLRIEGNADERGTPEFNKQLGQERADNVRAALIAKGVSEKQISVKSNGKNHPRATGHDEESWAENRRADLVYEAR